MFLMNQKKLYCYFISFIIVIVIVIIHIKNMQLSSKYKYSLW